METQEELREIDAWSVSALKSIGTCGKQWLYRYHTPSIDAEVTPPLAFGSAVHKCIERIHKEDKFDPQDWQEMWSDEWYEHSKVVNWNAYRKSQFDKLGPQMLAQYIKNQPEGTLIDSEYGFGSEHRGQDLYSIGTHRIKGVIDQIWRRPDGRLLIVDLKTSKQKPDHLMLRADPQFTLYWHAAREKFGEEPLMAWYHLRTGELIYTKRTANDLLIAKEMLEEAKVKVTSKMFARNINYHCNFCPYMTACLGELDV